MDTIIGKNNKGAILTINERKTGWLWTYKLSLIHIQLHLSTALGFEFAMDDASHCFFMFE